MLGAYGHAEECCVSSSSATSGLTAALIASGAVGPVLVPAFTFAASIGAVRAAGLHPIVVDVDPETWACAPETLQRALAETHADAVMLVSPFGMQQDWSAALELCEHYGAAVIVDNASGLGVARQLHCASPVVFEVFSLHATKPFAIGEGGVVFAAASNENALRSSLNFGLPTSATSTPPGRGINGKLSEFHAAIGLVQIRRIDDSITNRVRFVERYRSDLAEYPSLFCPGRPEASPWQFYPVLMPDVMTAEQLIVLAAQNGVEIRRYYRPSLSRWPDTQCFGRCHVAETLADRVCVLPVRGRAHESVMNEITGAVSEAVAIALAQSCVAARNVA